jgi:hypothetical protein
MEYHEATNVVLCVLGNDASVDYFWNIKRPL